MKLKSLRTINFLKAVHQEVTNTLPVGGSRICYFIILVIMEFDLQKKPLRLKELFSSLGMYSIMGLRYHLDELVRNEWVKLKPCEKDRRVKMVIPTPALREKFSRFTSKVDSITKSLAE